MECLTNHCDCKRFQREGKPKSIPNQDPSSKAVSRYYLIRQDNPLVWNKPNNSFQERICLEGFNCCIWCGERFASFSWSGSLGSYILLCRFLCWFSQFYWHPWPLIGETACALKWLHPQTTDSCLFRIRPHQESDLFWWDCCCPLELKALTASTG